jgi:hypothetical protein
MRSLLLFSAAATIAFFVTLEFPAQPDASFQSDFEPTRQMATVEPGAIAPKLPDEEASAL